MKNNELIVRKESLLTKLRKLIYKFLHRNSIKTKKGIQAEPIYNLNKNNDININKENALKIYNDLRSGKINIYQVPDDYLEVIKEFLTKEIQLKKNRLNSIKTEINETKYSIKSYEEKIKKYQA